MVLLTITFINKSFEVRILDTTLIGFICLSVVEFYGIVILTKLYSYENKCDLKGKETIKIFLITILDLNTFFHMHI